jgi:hypothetical protein
MVSDSRQRGVFQTIKKARFALDRLSIVVVHEERLFDRNDTAETFVGRNINCAHAALSDLSVNSVALLQKFAWFDHR